MSRQARVVAEGVPHHATQRGNNRQDIFLVDDDRRFYIQTLKQKSELFGLTILGYCLMTNHVHVIAVPRRPDSLAKAPRANTLALRDALQSSLQAEWSPVAEPLLFVSLRAVALGFGPGLRRPQSAPCGTGRRADRVPPGQVRGRTSRAEMATNSSTNGSGANAV